MSAGQSEIIASMKAIVKTKEGRGIEVLDVDMPKIGKTDILVRVAAASLCGSDVYYYHWLPAPRLSVYP